MRIIKFFCIAVALLCGEVAVAQVTLNEVQKKAQKSIIEFLRSKHYSPSIDTNDQSVCFKKNDVLYWITFEGSGSPLLYTIHRKGIKFASDKDNTLNRRREIAEKAANMVCAQRVVKAYMNGNKVDFCLPMYAATPEDFQKVFGASMATFDNIKQVFDNNYKKGRVIADSIHSYWSNLDTTVVVVPQNNYQEVVRQKSLIISSFSVRVVDAGNSVISDYDKSIRKNSCRYLQERVELTAKNDGIYKLGVKLYTPEGKLLVPTKDARFTTITSINVPKANKTKTYELLKFGSDNGNIWKAGEYKIEFYEDDTNIYSNTINIL